MLPIILNPSSQKVLLIGDGPATERRAEMLYDAGVDFDRINYNISQDRSYNFIFAADVTGKSAEEIYDWGKSIGALVNIEDVKEYCDFHVPAIVRRGDLLLTVSTGGGSPRVARRLRMMLENIFSEIWSERLNAIKEQRITWKKQGDSLEKLAKKTDMFMDKQGWMQQNCECLRNSN